MTSASIDTHAQHVLQAIQGDPSAPSLLADAAITRSWRRCLDQHHLDPASPRAPSVLERPRLQDHRAPLDAIMDVARWQMNSLHRQLGEADQVVLLTDAQGVVIDSVYRDAERAAFQRAGLWLGAVWREDCEGTNGVGTCLVERQQVSIRRDEHFRGRHAGLSCSASPIFNPHGELLAVLNLSSAGPGRDAYQAQHAMALTHLSAKLIESCFFLGHDPQGYLLRLHPDARFVGLLGEGLIGLDDTACIRSINQAALDLLGLTRKQAMGGRLASLLATPVDHLLGQACAQPGLALPVRLADGRTFYAQVRAPLALRPRPAPASAKRPMGDPHLCLEDPRLQRGLERAVRVLERDVPVFLHGETGTGKEAFATALHHASTRADQPLVAINCAAIPETLIESELFGYRGGSFTGARKEGMVGKLEQAHGGVLFLDEIGDMPLALQTRLLRVLEERQVVPLGGANARPLDVRVVSASHQDLRERVADGRFREDLYYRLCGFSVTLPPLRERTDKSPLFDRLWHIETRHEAIRLDTGVKERLLTHDWPGNVRQLRTCLKTLAALAIGGQVSLEDVADVLPEVMAPETVEDDPLGRSERETLLKLIEAERWHIGRVATRLGLSRNTVYRKLRQHGISRQLGAGDTRYGGQAGGNDMDRSSRLRD